MKQPNQNQIFQSLKNRIRIARCQTASKCRHPYSLLGAAIASFSWMAMASHSNAQLLGSAENFTVVSGAGVTSSGFTVINGDVGLFPLDTIIGFNFSTIYGDGVVNGTVYYPSSPEAPQAQTDARTGYNTLAGMALTSNLTGTDLGGLTLAPGVYRFNTSAELTGNLTLDNTAGNASTVFVFQIGSTLTTAVGSSVTILGDAPTIYWQVGASATLNSNTDFSGNIIADQSVSFGTGSRLVNGRAIALIGAVSLLGNSVSNPDFILASTGRYWSGEADNLWSGLNWSSSVDGNDQVLLGTNVDAIFSVNDNTLGDPPQNQDTDLDADTTISSLTVNDTEAVTISGLSKLTINTTGLVSGININSGAGLTTINSRLELGNLPNIKVDSANGLIINGVISGTNGLTKLGSGALALTGANTYTGPTAVNAGTVYVGNSAAFGIGSLTLNDGIIDTYNSQSVQIIVDSYEQTGGVIRMHIEGTAPGTYTQFNVAKTADITGGTVFVYDLTGNYVPVSGDIQNIITAVNPLTGEFDSNSPYSRIYNSTLDEDIFYHEGDTLLYPTVTYDANNAYITWVQGAFSSILNLTPNQTSVSNMLDAYGVDHPGDPTGIATYLSGPISASLPSLYDDIAPDELSSIYQIGFTNAGIQNTNIQRHLELARQSTAQDPSQETAVIKNSDTSGKGGMVAQSYINPRENTLWNFFAEGTDGSATVDGDGNGSGYSFDTTGITAGADRHVSDNLIVGFLGSYTDTQAHLINNGSLDAESYKVAAYATAYSNGFYVDALLGLGINEYDSNRSSLLGYAEGNTQGLQIDAMLNAGYDFHHGQWTLSPMASIAYTRVYIDSFTETGSMSPLSFPDQHQESLRSNIGARLAYTAFVNEMTITPQVRLSWQHEFMDSTQSVDSQFTSGNGPMFAVDGPAMDRDRALISAGLSVKVTPAFSVYAFYDTQLGNSGYSSDTVSAGFNYAF